MKGGSPFSSKAGSPTHSHHHHSYVSTSSTPPRAAVHHAFSERMMDENIQVAEALITKWAIETNKDSPLFADDRREAKRFLEAVSGLQTAMQYYIHLNSSSQKIIRAQSLMQMAIKRLEKEFYLTLSANRKNLDSESISGSGTSRASARSSIQDFYEDDQVISDEEDITTTSPTSTPRTPPRGGDSISEADRASDIAMEDLKCIVDCMISSGYGRECVNIYKLIRKSIIDETLYYLGVEKLNYTQMQKMDWNVLESKIKSWLRAVKIAIKTLFNGERILCDIVFSSSENTAVSCFTEISRDAAVNLFSFPENFGKSKKILSPEKMFRALDLYEAIADLWPEIESIFSHESLSAVRDEAMAALVKLGEAVRVMLTQFEEAIQKDSSKMTSAGGVHPLTRYVMNYLVFVGDYSGPVSDIVADWSINAHTPLPQSYFSSPISGGGEDPGAVSITARLAWLILVLLCKLDAKAALYTDVALSYLFLANNLNYVVSKVRDSSLGLLMGPEWIWKNRSKVNQYIANYERMGWSKVISSLPENPTAEIPPQEVQEFFRRFNSNFEEVYKKQSSWAIPDPKLRDDVKISLAKKIVPSYQAFYDNSKEKCTREVGFEPIVRYAPEDLNNYLSDLFRAAAGSNKSSYSESSRGR